VSPGQKSKRPAWRVGSGKLLPGADANKRLDEGREKRPANSTSCSIAAEARAGKTCWYGLSRDQLPNRRHPQFQAQLRA